jgi:hypothetical protein
MILIQKKTVTIGLVAFAALAVAATAFSISWPTKSGGLHQVSNGATPDTQQTAARRKRFYVQRGALWHQLRQNLAALGDRLERPGKEQVLSGGRLTRAGVHGQARIELSVETADRISLTIQGGAQSESTVFDGTGSSWAGLTQWQRDLVATLLFDTPENFFVGQMNGSATRRLGSRFRSSPDNITGPFHDIYAVTNSDSLSADIEGAKLFYFNSDTFLLDRISYRLRRDGQSVPVEVRLSDWREGNGQKTARTVERIENGATVMKVSIDSVAFAPAAPRAQ